MHHPPCAQTPEKQVSFSNTNHLFWEIADKVIAVNVVDGESPLCWQESLLTHRLNERHLTDVDCELDVMPLSTWINPVKPYGVKKCETSAKSPFSKYVFERHDFSGVLECINGRYKGRFHACGDTSIPLHVLIRSCLSLLCEDEGSLLVHASGVWRRDRVWVFCGVSGSGKSTIAQDLSGGGEIFSQDRVVLRPREDGVIEALSTPFSDERSESACPKIGIVAGIVFIEQATETRITPVTTHEAVRTLLAESLVFTRPPDGLERLLVQAGIIAQSGTCSRLDFSLDESFWLMLDEQL
jgi:hypothetical protein